MHALPQEVQDYLYSQDMASVIEKVGEKNRLHLDQMGTLEAEAAAVILGFTEPNDFPSVIERSLDLGDEQAQAVSNDVDTMLFQHVRELVRESMPTVVPTGVVNGRMGAVSGGLPPLPRGEGGGEGPGANTPVIGANFSPPPSLATPLASTGSDKVSFADRALSGPTESMIRTVDVTPATPIKHAVDPYREPVE